MVVPPELELYEVLQRQQPRRNGRSIAQAARRRQLSFAQTVRQPPELANPVPNLGMTTEFAHREPNCFRVPLTTKI